MEGSDTVVVMTISQAKAMNNRFVAMRSEIDTLKVNGDRMMGVANKYANDLFHEKLKNAQASQSQSNQALMFFLFWGAFVTYLQFF